MRILGMDFAPLFIPLERRFQTFGALYFASSFLFAGFGGLAICVFLLFTSYYYLSLIYFTWLYYDWNVSNEGGRTIKWVREWTMWRHLANYFPIKLVKTVDLDPNQNYILGYHPHGIMATGAFCNFSTEGTDFSIKFPGIKPHLLTLEGQFQFPLHRELILSTGAAAATKEGIEWFLTREEVGHALVIVIGGAAEALDARPNESYKLTINRRKGFVKLALRHGVSLVPVFSFGENDLFDQLDNPQGSILRAFQDKITKLMGFSTPIVHGRGIFNYTMGYLPYRRPMVTVVGKPMELKKIENPTDEQVTEVHEEYLRHLQELFDEHKGKYGLPGQEIIFS